LYRGGGRYITSVEKVHCFSLILPCFLKKVHNFFSKVVEVERRQGGVGEKRGKSEEKNGGF
jgi:hypothetical protein